MSDTPSRLDLFQLGRNYIEARAKNLAPGIVDVEGSDANLYVGSASFMASACVQHANDCVGAIFLGSAEGEDLDWRAYDRDLVVRLGAAPARGTARFFRPTAVNGAGTIPIGTKINALTGPQYVTTTTATFGGTDLEARAEVRATKSGKSYQLGTNQLRLIVPSSPPIFDSTLQVTNDQPTAGGEEREEDIEYRLRVMTAKRASARGTLDAIVFGAKTTPGVVSASGIETLTGSNTFPARVVQLFIADSSGVASRALARVTQENLNKWRACGIYVALSTSQPQLVSVQLHLAFLASTQGTTALVEQIRASVVGFVNSLPVGAGLYLGDLYALIRRYAQVGLIPNSSTIVTPEADLIPDAGITLRTDISLVTIV